MARRGSRPDLRGKKVLVVGLARSGVAAAEFLLSRGAQVVATDLHAEQELSSAARGLSKKGAELVAGGHPPGLVRDAALVVVSPGVPPSSPPLVEARERGIATWGELELAYRETDGWVVAVTGTKGKSTTATLISEILLQAGRKSLLAGNIGRPWIALADETTRDTISVIEVSSFQLELTESFRPDVAVLLDVAPDHLDRYPHFAAYCQAKARLFAGQREGDWAVVYGANPLTIDMASRSSSRKVYFSADCLGGTMVHYCQKGPWLVRDGRGGPVRPLVPVASVNLKGRHHLDNVLAATAVADLLRVSPGRIQGAVVSFRGIPHALEKVAEIGGVAFYDDSKATNVLAAAAALKSFDRGVILIIGGRSKGDDFALLRQPVARVAKLVLVLGESRETVVRALSGAAPLQRCHSLREAVEIAFAAAEPGDTVLLSPACASFDMFLDYADRGRRFREEIERLRRGISGAEARGEG